MKDTLIMREPAAPAFQAELCGTSRAEPKNPLRFAYFLEPAIALAAMVILAPAALVTGVIIFLLARRCPLVRHTRVGWRGSRLRLLKFRTMWDRNPQWGPVFAVEDVSGPIPCSKHQGDDRVTSRFAAWCRRYSLDELPQLYHIARGEMSLVGPRPITRAELEAHYGAAAAEVLSVRPGLTGLWQILGRNRLSYSKRKRLDVWFARHASAGLYLRILVRSIPKVLSGHGSY